MVSYFKNKKVLITGHTGFKGTWLIHLLNLFDAHIYGYSLAPLEHQLLFKGSEAEKLCKESVFGDINDYNHLSDYIEKIQPDVVFHLAAQALVIDSYKDPVYTFSTNIMGTVHLLESLKKVKQRCNAILITTDKVYQNNEDGRLYTEDDKLGGKDPYSASKACDEIIIESYRQSFFNEQSPFKHIRIASVRAGNVIGGGDYSENRIIPDIVRAIESNNTLEIRNPHAIRPWQHVLEPLFAYCQLCVQLDDNVQLAGAFNIGPYAHDMLEVEEIVNIFQSIYGTGTYKIVDNNQLYAEAKILKLNNNKIKNTIGFEPKLSAEKAIEWTALWYKDMESSMKEKCMRDILKYQEL